MHAHRSPRLSAPYAVPRAGRLHNSIAASLCRATCHRSYHGCTTQGWRGVTQCLTSHCSQQRGTQAPVWIDAALLLGGAAAGARRGGVSASLRAPPAPSRSPRASRSRWPCTSTPASARDRAAWMRTCTRRAGSASTWSGGPTTISARWPTATARASASTAPASPTPTGTSTGTQILRTDRLGHHSFVDTPVNPDEPGGKMQVVAVPRSSGADWGNARLQAQAQNSVYSTSYSDTTVELDIYPQQLGADAASSSRSCRATDPRPAVDRPASTASSTGSATASAIDRGRRPARYRRARSATDRRLAPAPPRPRATITPRYGRTRSPTTPRCGAQPRL